MTDHYAAFDRLKFDRPAPRVLRVTLDRGKANEMDYRMHHQLATVWEAIDGDPDTSVSILTGAGRFFSAGGDFADEEKVIAEFDMRVAMWKDGRDLVRNLINASKPLISAINGPAAGGGLVAAMFADISIAGKSAKIVDGHTRLGVAAGDHATLYWPLATSMAKAKYYLLTCDRLSGEEAEKMGLVTMCVPDDELQAKAIEVASKLAAGAPSAIRWTKYALNNWYRMAWPIFDASLALEMLGFGGPEVKEGLASHLEKRPPRFDPKCPI